MVLDDVICMNEALLINRCKNLQLTIGHARAGLAETCMVALTASHCLFLTCNVWHMTYMQTLILTLLL